MRKVILIPLVALISGCISFEGSPISTPIYDDFITLVESDVNLGKQTIYKNEKLTHHKINGIDAYCSDVSSMNLNIYRCFSHEDNMLTHGFNAIRSTWEPLKIKIKVINKPL